MDYDVVMSCSPGTPVTFTDVPVGRTLVAIVRAEEDFRVFTIERIFRTPNASDDCDITLINNGIQLSIIDGFGFAVAIITWAVQGSTTGVMCSVDEAIAVPCESLFSQGYVTTIII